MKWTFDHVAILHFFLGNKKNRCHYSFGEKVIPWLLGLPHKWLRLYSEIGNRKCIYSLQKWKCILYFLFIYTFCMYVRESLLMKSMHLNSRSKAYLTLKSSHKKKMKNKITSYVNGVTIQIRLRNVVSFLLPSIPYPVTW